MGETPARPSYELYVRRYLSPAMLASFPVAHVPTTVPRHTIHRLRVAATGDITEIIGRLTARQVEVLEIRRCPQAPPPQAAPSVSPLVADRSGVVVPLPGPRPAEDHAGDVAGDDGTDGGAGVVRLTPGGSSSAGRARGRRPRRRGARG